MLIDQASLLLHFLPGVAIFVLHESCRLIFFSSVFSDLHMSILLVSRGTFAFLGSDLLMVVVMSGNQSAGLV
jgi:hypothetical protein